MYTSYSMYMTYIHTYMYILVGAFDFFEIIRNLELELEHSCIKK